MKRKIMILLVTMLFSLFTACEAAPVVKKEEPAPSSAGKTAAPAQSATELAGNTETAGTTEATGTVETAETAKPTENTNTGTSHADILPPAVAEHTMGGNVWNVFLTMMKADAAVPPERIANAIIGKKEVFPYDGTVVKVAPGLLYGFDNETVTGFREGIMFLPIISVIPFVGYIFRLPEGADAEAFLNYLKDNCNLRWNISTSAEQIVAGAYGNTVLFVMCPQSPDGSFGG